MVAYTAVVSIVVPSLTTVTILSAATCVVLDVFVAVVPAIVLAALTYSLAFCAIAAVEAATIVEKLPTWPIPVVVAPDSVVSNSAVVFHCSTETKRNHHFVVASWHRQTQTRWMSQAQKLRL